MDLLHKDLTYQIRKCIFDVHNTLGIGYDEECYHIALTLRLKKLGIPFESKVTGHLTNGGQETHKFVADIIVDNKIILELKHTQYDFQPAHYAQIYNYLKFWNLEVGMLVNFGQSSANIKRVFFQEMELNIIENYEGITQLIDSNNRIFVKGMRKAILSIGELYGLGYRYNIYQSLIEAELNSLNIPFSPHKEIDVLFEGEVIRRYMLNSPIIANKILCLVVAQKKSLKTDISKMKNYLHGADLELGILANFGRGALEIIGVSP